MRALLASTLGVIALGAMKLWWASVLMDLKTFTMPIDASAMAWIPCHGDAGN
jgi:hypothetical protein